MRHSAGSLARISSIGEPSRPSRIGSNVGSVSSARNGARSNPGRLGISSQRPCDATAPPVMAETSATTIVRATAARGEVRGQGCQSIPADTTAAPCQTATSAPAITTAAIQAAAATEKAAPRCRRASAAAVIHAAPSSSSATASGHGS